MTLHEAITLVRDFGPFSIHRMSGGYVALRHNGNLICAWVTPEYAVQEAQRLAWPF